MVRGEWTGTMNLTEPQAGSDLAQIRTRAVPAGPNYRLHGQKIFITYGEHDLTENIVHMVLARIDGAPPGVRGISLFIVPKFWVNADGTPGPRNDGGYYQALVDTVTDFSAEHGYAGAARAFSDWIERLERDAVQARSVA